MAPTTAPGPPLPPGSSAPLLEMTGIGKSFPGVTALDGVSLTLGRGEVLALLGENGAGKSTLIKMLGGAHQPDAGTIAIDGRPARFPTPAAANAAGVAVIYQEFNLVPGLAAWENIFLGRERRWGFTRRSFERDRARTLFDQIGVPIPVDTPCGNLSIAQQQVVEIAKALSQDARLLVMDEPSAALTPQEVAKLFAVIRDLKRRGIGVIYISHRLDEIFEITDRVLVLRDGKTAGGGPTADLSRQRLIELMVGREIRDEFPKRRRAPGPTRLSVRGLCRGQAVRDVSFDVKAGEVLGLTGLIGAGRTETARLVFGADRADAGTITVDGREIRVRSPRDAIAAGICLLTEDRKGQGLVLDAGARDNFGLPNLGALSSWGVVRSRAERAAFGEYVDRLKIKIPHQNRPVRGLSGGNQQKVVLAKWLQRDAGVLIFDEPTRGIDVGARYEIYQLMNDLTARGKAIVMISSELPEVLGMSDRVLVMRHGRVSGEITDVAAATQEQIMALAVA